MAENSDLIAPSHPWINFRLDLTRLRSETWVALGECASKCEHIAGTPLRPAVRKQLHRVYLAKGVQATTAIEGNTLSEEEVLERIEGKLDLPPSKKYLQREVDNIIHTFELIAKRIVEDSVLPISESLLCEYNSLVLKDLNLDEGVIPGRLRNHNVGIEGARYRAPDHMKVAQLTDRLCSWLGEFEREAGGVDATVLAILKAVVSHLYVAWIHPFGDGNGRTARLLELDILLRAGVPSPAVHLLSNHYNATRGEYYRQLDMAGKTNDPTGFIAYAVTGFRDGLREQLKVITDQVRDVVWRNYVHETISGRAETARRQRHLVLDISLQGQPVARQDVSLLTPRLREAYRQKTAKTISRDLSKVVKMGVLIVNDNRYSPNLELLEAFMPLRRKGPG